MVTVFIQYLDGTSEEIQMPRADAMELVMKKQNNELPNISEIQVKGIGNEST